MSVLVFFAVQSENKLGAESPTADTTDIGVDRIQEFDLDYGSTLLLDTYFSYQPNKEIELHAHQFRKDIPESPMATPWFWAAKLITFDNRCSQITALGDPGLVRIEKSDTEGEKAWVKVEHPLLFEVEITVDPDMHELEIVDEEYKTVGKFDVALLLKDYCENNPEDGACLQRKNKLILLDTSSGTEDLDQYLLEEFDQLEHLGEATVLNEVEIVSGGGESVIALEMEKTSQSSTTFTSTNSPFDRTERNAIYNGSTPVTALSRGSSTSNDTEDADKSMTLSIKNGVRGLAFTLGQIDSQSVLNQNSAIAEASSKFDHFLEIGEPGQVRQLAQSIQNDASTIAKLAVFDTSGSPIDTAEVIVHPVPGFHTFVGLITPNTLIGSVTIEYKGATYEESLTDLMIMPEEMSKLPSKNFNQINQPCPGFPMVQGSIAKFRKTSEVFGKPESSVPKAPESAITPGKIESYISALVDRGYSVLRPGERVEKTDTVDKKDSTAPKTDRTTNTQTSTSKRNTPRATATASPATKAPKAVAPKATRGAFDRSTGGVNEDETSEEKSSGGACNNPAPGYGGMPLLAVLLIPAYLKYYRSRNSKNEQD